MRHRVFVAINLPERIKVRIKEASDAFKRKLANLPVRASFIEPRNWHLTLVFLGYQNDDEVSRISRVLEGVVSGISPTAVELTKTVYGPPHDKHPRLIWLGTSSETSSSLSRIKEVLENDLLKEKINFHLESRPLTGHITLARFKGNIRLSNYPVVKTDLNLKFTALSLDLMESELSRHGAEYSLLSSFSFKV